MVHWIGLEASKYTTETPAGDYEALSQVLVKLLRLKSTSATPHLKACVELGLEMVSVKILQVPLCYKPMFHAISVVRNRMPLAFRSRK